MPVIKYPAQRNISSLFTSQSHFARENLEKKPSFSFKYKISRIMNYLVKNSYSPYIMEIKLKLKKHKIQVELNERENQARERDIEHDFKKITISKPIAAVVPVTVFGCNVPADIKRYTKDGEVELSGDYYRENKKTLKINTIKNFSEISPKDAMVLFEFTELKVGELFS
ncbi:hypothetical protein [Yersinia mollaretii]|uniref:Uncharacterized protein n=1 Tax=Yersinia mollaretii TaxID=33060 RepID=A0AA36PPB3_YERMO|nr:hypothetical protein [Yersinia mollaretii]CNI45831.1 Uncharacterised protein [Yersinia mollaretii]